MFQRFSLVASAAFHSVPLAGTIPPSHQYTADVVYLRCALDNKVPYENDSIVWHVGEPNYMYCRRSDLPIKFIHMLRRLS